MKPIDFKEANFTFLPPQGEPDVLPLRVRFGDGMSVSCWQMSWRERLSALLFGRCWLYIMSQGMPPVLPVVLKNPFGGSQREA